MNNLPSRLEKYDKEGWYRYLHRAINLKNAPNPDLDMNVFTRCIVGRCRRGEIYFSKKIPETYCETCKLFSRTMFEQYNILIIEGRDSKEGFMFTLSYFLDHLEKIHSS